MSKAHHSKISSIFSVLFTVLFVGAAALALIGRALCIRDNRNYSEKQNEIFVVEEIATVLSSEESGLIYVCYNDASCVNVYTTSGEFKWAVSTPYLRNVYFDIIDGQLVIYNDEAYLYDAVSGDFIEKTDAESLNLDYDWETDSAPVDEMAVGTICFDTYEVYRVAEDGSLLTIVARPGWYWLFNFGLLWIIGFGSGICLFILSAISKSREEKAQKRSLPEETPLSKKVKCFLRYFQITSAVHIVYAAADLACGFFYGGFLTIGILPLAIHFILSIIVLYNLIERTEMTEYEEILLDKWKMFSWVSFIVAFLSVIAAVMIAG